MNKILAIFLTLALVQVVKSETVSCKVIPFETKEGITGSCCVFFKNDTKFDKTTFTHQVDRIAETEKNQTGWVKKNNFTNTNGGKNAFDIPEKCPEGQLKDHSGDCSEPF